MQKLSFRTKLAFGTGDLGPAIVAAIHGFFLLDFLINVAGLGAAAAGTVLLIVKIWDAVNDPIMGWLSDKTQSAQGRRRPWLLWGSVPFGLAFFLHWVVPPLDDTGKFIYYIIVALLLDTAYTAVNVPYTALTAELTPDYDERTSLTSFRFGFSILGGVLASFMHTQILGAFPEQRALGSLVSIGLWSVVSMVGFWITFAGTREPARAAPTQEGPGFIEGLTIAFQNRPFVLVTVIYLLSWLTIQFVQNNLFIYARDAVGMAEGDFGLVLLALQFSAFVWVIIWGRVSERIGKKAVYYIGAVIFMAALLGLFFVPKGQTTLLYALGVVGGIGAAVAYLIPWSMLPDVIELDELQTGQRREGVFYGFFVFLQKMGLSIGLFVSGLVLEAAGYVGAAPGEAVPIQSEAVQTALRVLVGPVGAGILLLSFIAVYLYPITKAKHAEIKAQLAAKRQAAQR